MSTSQSHPGIHLAAHVRACRVGDQMIFLDLLRSKYIGIGGPQIAALSHAILGTATTDCLQSWHPDNALLGKYVRHLRQQQLLSAVPALASERRPPVLQTPAAGLTIDEDDDMRFEGCQLLCLWRSTFIVSEWLRRRSLADIAERLVALRERQPYRRNQASTATLHGSVTTYFRLRPFALSTHDRCLNDSLTLIHFLTTQGLFAHWVIGVRTNPFGAHSWAQTGDIVLNDYPERVRHFEPILVV
jgi:hypothetical protein